MLVTAHMASPTRLTLVVTLVMRHVVLTRQVPPRGRAAAMPTLIQALPLSRRHLHNVCTAPIQVYRRTTHTVFRALIPPLATGIPRGQDRGLMAAPVSRLTTPPTRLPLPRKKLLTGKPQLATNSHTPARRQSMHPPHTRMRPPTPPRPTTVRTTETAPVRPTLTTSRAMIPESTRTLTRRPRITLPTVRPTTPRIPRTPTTSARPRRKIPTHITPAIQTASPPRSINSRIYTIIPMTANVIPLMIRKPTLIPSTRKTTTHHQTRPLTKISASRRVSTPTRRHHKHVVSFKKHWRLVLAMNSVLSLRERNSGTRTGTASTTWLIPLMP